MAKKSKMDRGLDSLFFDNSIDEVTRSDSKSEKNDDGENGISTVRISLIEPDKNQPRSEFDEDALNELAENIRQHGVLQPILVRPLDNGGYKIVAGERRWRAARLAGLDEIPVYIKELTDLEAAEISLIENIQRKDLHLLRRPPLIRLLWKPMVLLSSRWQKLLDVHVPLWQTLSDFFPLAKVCRKCSVTKSSPRVTQRCLQALRIRILRRSLLQSV